jgi:prolyl oligopeptidase
MSVVLVGVLTASMLGLPAHAERNYTYPDARQADVVEDYHGTMVADPYRWMEDP